MAVISHSASSALTRVRCIFNPRLLHYRNPVHPRASKRGDGGIKNNALSAAPSAATGGVRRVAEAQAVGAVGAAVGREGSEEREGERRRRDGDG